MVSNVFDVVRACRRSRIKVRVYAALAENPQMLVAELADAALTTPARVRGALHGDREEFSLDTSLVMLGVARALRDARGATYALTPQGARLWPAVRARLPRGALPVATGEPARAVGRVGRAG